MLSRVEHKIFFYNLGACLKYIVTVDGLFIVQSYQGLHACTIILQL